MPKDESFISIGMNQFKDIKDVDTKLNILFLSITEVIRMLQEDIEKTDRRFDLDCARFKKLEGQKKINAAMSFCGGIIGGVIAFLTGKHV